MVIRYLIAVCIVLALIPTTRPVLIRTLCGMAHAIAGVLVVILAIGAGRRP
jgi:hypothetical protein